MGRQRFYNLMNFCPKISTGGRKVAECVKADGGRSSKIKPVQWVEVSRRGREGPMCQGCGLWRWGASHLPRFLALVPGGGEVLGLSSCQIKSKYVW